MPVYCVSYDLKGENRNYLPLFAVLQQSSRWWHYLESTWLISTNESPQQLWERIRPTIQARDFLLIIEVRDNISGWLPKDAWEWIHTNVPRPP